MNPVGKQDERGEQKAQSSERCKKARTFSVMEVAWITGREVDIAFRGGAKHHAKNQDHKHLTGG